MLEQRFKPLRRMWPIGLYWLLLMVGDFVAARWIAYSRWNSEWTPTVIFSFFLGQFGLVAVLGGLLGRTWMSGWMLAIALTTTTTALCQLGTQQFAQESAIVAFWPALMLAACAPLIAMRGLRGWSLTLGAPTLLKHRAGVEDLFLLSIVVACSLTLMRVLNEFDPGGQSTQELFVLVVFFGLSLFFVVPATAVTFRAKNWRQRLSGWVAIGLAAGASIMTISWISEPQFWSKVSETLGHVAVSVVTSSLTMAIGGYAMLASGLKLTRFSEAASDVQDLPEESEAIEATGVRRQARWLTGGVVFTTLAVSGWLSYRDYRQLKFLESVQALDNQGKGNGSSLAIRDDKVISLVVGSLTTDETFSHISKMRDLERISLAHSLVTDRIVPELKKFPKLRSLDFSNTKFSDAGLEQLRSGLILNELSVANTRVTFDKAFAVARSMQISKLDISELGIDDDQLFGTLDLGNLNSLALRGNPITDKGLTRLLEAPQWLNELDLSNTDIDGSGLLTVRCPQVLKLDGTKITDVNLTKILQANPGISVSLKNTAITAQVLKVAASVQASLSLGGGKITDRDLANLGAVTFGTVGLNGKEFTGACFANSGIQLTSLDMSHSGLTDATFLHLKGLAATYLSSLNLAHTNVTDAIFPTLLQLQCAEVDLRHTKVTAQGILGAQLSYTRIIVGHNQFTAAELNAMRDRLLIAIDEASSW